MSSSSNYTFNKFDRITNDTTDNTQRNLQNTKFANYSLSSYFEESITTDNIKFATQQPNVMINGTTYGTGLHGDIVDFDSLLNIKKEQERPLEKLSLNQRMFLTIPYLGRGSCDTDAESQLLQGENITDKKSISTVMDKSFLKYTMQPTDAKMVKSVDNFTVEESALDGWVRGGMTSRTLMEQDNLGKTHRPKW
jgi:hypothetical protein